MAHRTIAPGTCGGWEIQSFGDAESYMASPDFPIWCDVHGRDAWGCFSDGDPPWPSELVISGPVRITKPKNEKHPVNATNENPSASQRLQCEEGESNPHSR